MASGVVSRGYVLRKTVEDVLYRWAPWMGIVPLYTMVSFGNMPYSLVKEKWVRQGRLLKFSAWAVFGTLLGLILRFRRRWYISMLAADIISPCGLSVQCGISCSYPFFTPNKYEIEPCALSSERSRSITLLKIPSSTTSHRNSSSSSLSFHFLGSKCQNSCNASNLCFFCH